MKRTIPIVVLIFLFSCGREVALFSAYDELHGIELYKSNEFEILYNGINTAEGKYEFRNDTIYLTYNSDELILDDKSGKEISANEVLPRKILVNRTTKRVESIGRNDFCARIDIDKIKE